MIEEKLRQARQRSTRRRMQLAIIILAAVILSGLGIFGLSTVDFSSRQSVQTAAAPPAPPSEENRDAIRAEFKLMVQQYENELEPRLQAASLELWNSEAAQAITELKKKVMTDFSSGEYQVALENLHVLKNKAEQVLQEAERLYADNLAQAASFLARDLYPEAKLHIQKALLVAPQSATALKMQQQIEKLPRILPLLHAAEAARAENDLDKEADYLQQILHLVPERQEAEVRLAELTELRQNQKFADHIASGFSAVDNRQVKEARYHYQEAKKIGADRQELTILSSRLLTLEKSLRVARAIDAAEQAVRRDDWLQAKVNFSKVLGDAPKNKTAMEGLSRADKVLELQAQFNGYFQEPYRLAHPDVHREAEKTLALAADAARYSFGIKRQAKQLQDLLHTINRLIPVTITSDGKTTVMVRSVGRVGAVSQKVIQLKPGTYTFEGVRKGYKSKLIRASIPYDRDTFSVHVVCDEPI